MADEKLPDYGNLRMQVDAVQRAYHDLRRSVEAAEARAEQAELDNARLGGLCALAMKHLERIGATSGSVADRAQTAAEIHEAEVSRLRAKCEWLEAEVFYLTDELRIYRRCNADGCPRLQSEAYCSKHGDEQYGRGAGDAPQPEKPPEPADRCSGKCDPCGRECRLRPGHSHAHDCGKDATCHKPADRAGPDVGTPGAAISITVSGSDGVALVVKALREAGYVVLQ